MGHSFRLFSGDIVFIIILMNEFIDKECKHLAGLERNSVSEKQELHVWFIDGENQTGNFPG